MGGSFCIATLEIVTHREYAPIISCVWLAEFIQRFVVECALYTSCHKDILILNSKYGIYVKSHLSLIYKPLPTRLDCKVRHKCFIGN